MTTSILLQLYKLKDRMKDILSYVLQVEQSVESVKVNKAKVRVWLYQLLLFGFFMPTYLSNNESYYPTILYGDKCVTVYL